MTDRVSLLPLATLGIAAVAGSRRPQVDPAIVRGQVDALTVWRMSKGSALIFAQRPKDRSKGDRATVEDSA